MRGYIHLYEGDGKGKTTAAVGLMVRFAGAGGKVLFTQFLKPGDSSELNSLKQLPNVTLLLTEKSFGFTFSMTEEEKQAAAVFYRDYFERIRQQVSQENYGLLVLDEITDCCNKGMIQEEELRHFLLEKPENLEVVLTGRKPGDGICQLADYHTHMESIRHPYQQGIQARTGIER